MTALDTEQKVGLGMIALGGSLILGEFLGVGHGADRAPTLLTIGATLLTAESASRALSKGGGNSNG